MTALLLTALLGTAEAHPPRHVHHRQHQVAHSNRCRVNHKTNQTARIWVAGHWQYAYVGVRHNVVWRPVRWIPGHWEVRKA